MAESVQPTTEDQTPDFWGSWLDANPLVDMAFEDGRFLLFIESREALESGREKVRGIISDCHGPATFEGEFSHHSVTFVKRYTEEAKQRGAAKHDIEYAGQRNGQLYQGRYIVKNGISQGRRQNWEGSFFMTDRRRTIPVEN